MAIKQTTQIDPVAFSIIASGFVNLVDEIVSSVRRSCMSLALWVGDFSGSIMNADGDLVSQGTRDLSAHVGVLQPCTKAVIEDFGKENLRPGDVYVYNDPYRGGTHLPDMTFIRPVFWDGRLIAFAVTKGHWSDVGGSTPGSMDAMADEIYKEGLFMPPVKLIDQGVLRKDVEKLILSNLRLEEECAGDMRAQIQGTGTGEQRLHQMIEKYGLDTILAAFDECIDTSERQLTDEILNCPEGTWEAEDFLDYDPKYPERGPVRVHVKMTLTHSPPRILYDVRGSGPPTHAAMNATESSSLGALVAATKYIFPKPFLNVGWHRVISAIFPDSSVLNVRRPQACCGETSGAYEKVIRAVIECWSQIKPERSFAGNFNVNYFLGGGRESRPGFGDKYFMFYHWHNGGWGGRFEKDGRDGGSPIFGAGLVAQSIEHMEKVWPIFIEKHTSLRDSMGAGKWRGGVGTEAILRIETEGGATMSYVCDRGKYGPGGPPGLFGGERAIHEGVTKNIGKPNEKYLDVYFSNVQVDEGETMHHYSSGGGGYGDPLERDPKAVLEDVLDDFVSVERARTSYGVVINALDPDVLHYEVDQAATSKLRSEMRKNHLP